MGIVYKATNRRTKIKFAIKAIKKEEEEYTKLLKSEADLLLKIDHPNVLKIFDIYENGAWLFFVEELCEGGEVFDYVRQKEDLDEREVAGIIE